MAFTQPPMGPPVGNPMGAPNQAPNPDALMQELSALAQRAQEIMAQLQSMGVDPAQLMGGGPPGPEILAPPPEMPMPPVGSMPPGGLLA